LFDTVISGQNLLFLALGSMPNKAKDAG